MGDKSKIEWTDASWTPVRARNKATGKIGWHCEHATPGCLNCYSESINIRLGTGLPFKPGHRDDVEIFLDEEMLLAPLHWKRPRMIFVCSMTDLFADFVRDEWIDQIFAVMALAPAHTFQVLTKRPERMLRYMTRWPDGAARFHHVALAARKIRPDLPNGADGWTWKLQARWPLQNVWLGVSVEDQRRADERRDDLRAIAELGSTTFVSYEPALGPVDWTGWEFTKQIISGGESGPRARPSDIDWFRKTRDFCAVSGIACFVKQLTIHGRKLPFNQWPSDVQIREFPDASL